MDDELRARIAEVRRRLTVESVVERHVKLSGRPGSKNQRGQCPFHQGQSASFSVPGGKDYAHCFGCGWHGDVVAFVRDLFRLSFMDALAECEKDAGILAGEARERTPQPISRERRAAARADRPLIDSLAMGRELWRRARADLAPIRRYFEARGVPSAMLGGDRLAEFRYLATCPVHAWREGGTPRGVPVAPAVLAMVRAPRLLQDESGAPGRLEFVPLGLHVTYLDPAGTGTMVRRKPWAKADDPDPWLPKRRMLGPVGHGAVLLGAYRADARMWIGEGNETVLSGMALGGAGEEDVGVATLSLDNLQGAPRLWKNRTWPLHAIEPDPERPCFLIPGHTGPVTGLVDSDMNPLKAQRVVERKGGPLLDRAITGAERTRICGELFVKSWRATGVAAEAMRAPMGMDFNDAIRASAGQEAA